MSSFRTAMLALEDQLFAALLSPKGLDQCPVKITLRTRTWSGGAIDVGTTTDVDLVFPQQYFCRKLTVREIESSGGRYENGDVEVSNITPYDPANPTVSFPRSVMAPVAPAEGVEIFYILEGEFSGTFTRGNIDDSDVYLWKMTLTKTRLTPT